jgi:SAM-dependent methyltransferase
MDMSGRGYMWRSGIRIGLACVRKEPLLGLKRLVLPVSYWRTAEFAYAWRQLRQAAGPKTRMLDLGSPKDLAVAFARDTGCEVVAVDILPEAVELSRRYAYAQGLDGSGPGKVRSEVQDGRRLPYGDASFDAAFSVSVLEHIPDRGDTAALRELVRVVKPGGLVVMTVPYDRQYRESFVQHDVYERKRTGADPVFFERHYDDAALVDRLVGAVDAALVSRELWGERSLRVEMLLDRLGRVRQVLHPVEPLLAIVFLDRVDGDGSGHAMAAFLTLRKPA